MEGRVRTIADLARLAGVSPGTVSRALAGKAMVREGTRCRIRALAAEHDFHPNQLASRLRSHGRTGVVGVVISSASGRRPFADDLLADMLGHLHRSLADSGLELLLPRAVPNEPDQLGHVVDSHMVDGVVVIGQPEDDRTFLRVAARYQPLLVWGSCIREGDCCSIAPDNRQAGRLQGAALLDRGARRIVFLANTAERDAHDRRVGLREVLSGQAEVIDLHVSRHACDIGVELDAHRETLRTVDGIAAGSDGVAMAALRYLSDHFVRSTDSVAVVGFGNLPLARGTIPRLTTVSPRTGEMADAVAAALLARIAGQRCASRIVAPMVIPGETS